MCIRDRGRRYVIVAFLFEDRDADELERRLDGADRKLDGGAGFLDDEEDDLSQLLANMNDQ